jgi:hypothetical protein
MTSLVPNHPINIWDVFQIWSCRIDNLKSEGVPADDRSVKFSKASQLQSFMHTKSTGQQFIFFYSAKPRVQITQQQNDGAMKTYESHPCITFSFKSK